MSLTPVNIQPGSQIKQRIVVLDYLRVIAVVILFFFHLGMIWVPEWTFHFKQSSQWYWLQNVLMLTSPWRMGLLWFIAGASLYAMQQSKGLLYLITRRSNAVLLPLLVGIYAVVPVQLFVEMTQQQATNASMLSFFWQFYFGDDNFFSEFSSGIWHHVDVNHLWFLRSLWRFTLLLVAFHWILVFLRRRFGVFNIAWLIGFVSLSLCTMYIEDSDIKRDVYGFTCLLYGYWFGHSANFWQWLRKQRYRLLLLFVLLTVTYEIGFTLRGEFVDRALVYEGAMYAYYIAKVVGLLAILALAHRVFVKPSTIFESANRYVFPFYVVHQSVLIGIGYYTSALFMTPFIAMVVTGLLSAVVCVGLLWLCKESVLFGGLLGKRAEETHWLHSTHAQMVIGILTLPLALRLVGVI